MYMLWKKTKPGRNLEDDLEGNAPKSLCLVS